MSDIMKIIHVASVVITGMLFLYRGTILLLLERPLARIWRILPHVNDTILLVSAIVLAYKIQQYPFVHGWLTAKVLALVVYIVLGMLAFKPKLPRSSRKVLWVIALLVFFYIILVARTHSPLPFS